VREFGTAPGISAPDSSLRAGAAALGDVTPIGRLIPHSVRYSSADAAPAHNLLTIDVQVATVSGQSHLT
jgi:hypothetical protein